MCTMHRGPLILTPLMLQPNSQASHVYRYPCQGKKTLSVDWGHLLTVMALAAWGLWYLADLRAVSLSLENTLLVQPLIFIFVLLLLAVVPQCLHKRIYPQIFNLTI